MRSWLFITIIGILIQCSIEVDQRPLDENCPTSQDATLYYATKHSIYHVLVNNIPHGLNLLLNTVESGEISSLTYNQLNHTLLFVSDSHPNRIFEVDIWTRTITHFDYENVDFREIVFDSNTGNVYFVDKLGAIGVCMWKSRCANLIKPSKIRNLILHPKYGRMFYINGMESDSVCVASMSGNFERKIASTQGTHAISVHPDKQFLFVNLEDSLLEIDLNLMKFYLPPHHMKASTIYYFNCKMYFVGRISKDLKVYKHEDKQKIHHFSDTAKYPLTIGVNERTTSKADMCKKLNCPGICVISEEVIGTKPECICNDECSKKKEVKEEKESGSNIHWILIGIFACILLLLTALFLTIKFRLSPILNNWIDQKFGDRSINVVKYSAPILIDTNNQ